MKVIIAAAGTAGHINPGIAIANKIMQEDKNSKIIFIGTTRGIENDLVPRSGFELKTIEAYGLSKKISIENIKKNIKTLQGFSQAKKIIQEFKPDIVIGTGGYICGAVISSAHKLKIPTLLHESNAFPGKATKFLSKKTNTILVSFKETKARLKSKNNVIHTGTPVKIQKQEYSLNRRVEILKSLGLKEDLPIVLVFGGSQGAKNINDALIEIITRKLNNKYQIVWAAGPKQYDKVIEKIKDNCIAIQLMENIKIFPYIYNMEEVMNVSDLIVARSGAMTITEIANLAKPSILIPLPNVSHNHQMYNAKVLEKVYAAKIIEDKNLYGEILDTTIKKIVLDLDKMKRMGENATKIEMKNVLDRIYNEIKLLVKK